jgi:hypothetical protein
MYPLNDPEGQLMAYEYMLKRLEEGRNSPSSFIGTLVASVLAAAATPTAIWLYFTIFETSALG